MVENLRAAYKYDSDDEQQGMTTMTTEISSDDIAYFNHAGAAPLSAAVREAGIKAIQTPTWEWNVTADQKRVRELFASLIEAEASQIAMTPSTGFATTLAANNIQRTLEKKKGSILVLQDEFDSAIYPWQNVCDTSNGDITLDIVQYPTNDGGWTEAILRKLEDPDVLVACLPPLHWTDGALIDLEVIGQACRKNNIYLIVDATQAVGIMECSVQKIQPTMLVCSVHKWLRCPPGMAIVYVSPQLHKVWEPLDMHGRSRDMDGGGGWDASKNEMGPKGYPETFFDDARKFDSGGRPNPLLLPMIRTSLEEVVKLDMPTAQETLRGLTARLLEWATANGYTITRGPHASHIIGLRPKYLTPQEMIGMVKALEQRGIILAVRCGGFRVSSYITTTEGEIDRLMVGLLATTPTRS